MKIIVCTILLLISVFSVIAGEGDHVPFNSLFATYYANAKSLLKSNPAGCIVWVDKAINESKNTGNKLDLGRSLFIKGMALEHLHQNKASIQFLQESLKVAKDSRIVDLEMKALDKLSTLYASAGEYKSALLYATLLQDRKDSVNISHQRVLNKMLPGKADLLKKEIKMKQLLVDNSNLGDHLRTNLQMIDNQGNWILIIVIAYSLIFLSFIMIKRQNKLILLKNKALTDQMHTLEVGKMELDHNRYKAEESDRLKSSFLSNISHDIRTPLNAVVGFSGFLRQTGKPVAERKQYIEFINRCSTSLLSLINEIFEIARIESGEIKQDPERIDLKEFLEMIQVQYCTENNQTLKNDFKLILNLPPNISVVSIKTYPDRLRNVLIHLIDNALKQSEQGKVEFGYTIKEPFIEFYVKDDGKGFPKNKIDDIFERFKMTNDFPKPGSGPIGLGLTISKNFIELMGGQIWVVSNKDKGSTFFFTLPLQLDL